MEAEIETSGAIETADQIVQEAEIKTAINIDGIKGFIEKYKMEITIGAGVLILLYVLK